MSQSIDRRYCPKCKRWTLTIVTDKDLRTVTEFRFRPGTTKVRRDYLCDSCAAAEGPIGPNPGGDQ